MTPQDSCKRYRDSDLLFYEELLLEKHEAFSCLYLQTYRQCVPYVVKRGSGQEQAKDLLQECLAIFVSKIRDRSFVYQEGTRITTYFQSIYINQWKKSLDLAARRSEISLESIIAPEDDRDAFETDLAESVLQEYDEDERNWIFKRLDRAFHLLAEDCRKVLRWFYIEDRSLRDIARELGMTEASATVKRYKCAKYLREKFHL
jgi:RNA polymerase sigma factor (sigma-70 family)